MKGRMKEMRFVQTLDFSEASIAKSRQAWNYQASHAPRCCRTIMLHGELLLFSASI